MTDMQFDSIEEQQRRNAIAAITNKRNSYWDLFLVLLGVVLFCMVYMAVIPGCPIPLTVLYWVAGIFSLFFARDAKTSGIKMWYVVMALTVVQFSPMSLYFRTFA